MHAIDANNYSPDHAARLQALLDSPPWRETIDSGLVDEVQADRIEPGRVRDFIDTAAGELLAFNEAKVRRLVHQGERDQETLFQEISSWPERLEGQDSVLSFLGLNVTSRCNFDPKCAYCNQEEVESTLGLDDWKAVIQDVTEAKGGEEVYLFITGGEPLLLGEDLWGDEGLIRFASERGAGVNVNTNAVMITPPVALRLIKAGLGKLHISLDSPDAEVQDFLFGGERFDQVLQGIHNIQIARDILGVSHPIIHVNCVLTNRNLDAYPRLFGFLLEMRKRASAPDDPFAGDLLPHVIPVGGEANKPLRPSEQEFREFYATLWPQVARMWNEYQGALGVPRDGRAPLFGYFANPFERVEHQGGLDAYVKTSAEGRYGRLALGPKCFVAPTQAVVTPDGGLHLCGSHAIRRILPIGNLKEIGINEGIRRGVAVLADMPDEAHCEGCALATLYINQAVTTKLREKVQQLLDEAKP